MILVAALLSSVLQSQSLPKVPPESEGFSTERLGRLTRYLQTTVDSGRAAGIVATIVRNGHVVYERAVGMADREARRPMAPTTLFRIASQSKAIASVAAMILVEEGRIGLGDPVSRYIPTFQSTTVATPSGIVPAKRQITIRDLLTHTSGMSYGTDSIVADKYASAGLGPNAGFGWYFADKPESICTYMTKLGTLPFVAQPGERWVYGYNTDVLGCIIERVSGMSLAELVRTRVTEPLGMRDTKFCVPPAERDRLATVYALSASGLTRAADGPRGQGDYVGGPCAAFSGGAGLISTAGDYARFLTMMVNGGTLNGTRILSPTTVELMTHDQVGDLYGGPESGFGLGFEIFMDPWRAGRYGSPGNYGWGGAYHTNYWADPERKVVGVVMTQLLPATGSVLPDRFRTLVYQAIVK